ncbi:MAG: hypothetical protein IJ357_09380 [Oscillospiraceae bacterium]|nr:hypothetical protein [Oscillospiraceae bacterium]
MDFNELKDRLFDLLNESDALNLLDLHLYDRENVLILEFPNGSSFELRCTLLSSPREDDAPVAALFAEEE